MTTWVFNDRTYKHRGVWHAVRGLIGGVVPEKIVENEYDVWKYHSKKCEWNQARHSVNEWYIEEPVDRWSIHRRKPVCSCDVASDIRAISIGKYTEKHITPEHTTVGPQDVLCGQVTIRDLGVSPVYRNYTKKMKPGDILTLVDRVKNVVFEGDLPPGPVCSRCVKKVEDA